MGGRAEGSASQLATRSNHPCYSSRGMPLAEAALLKQQRQQPVQGRQTATQHTTARQHTCTACCRATPSTTRLARTNAAAAASRPAARARRTELAFFSVCRTCRGEAARGGIKGGGR